MKINKWTTNPFMLALGALVFTLAAAALAMFNAPTVVKALGVASGSGFVPLQTTEGAGWAILGLAIGAGLAIGLAGIGGAITEKPETFGKSILYVVFIEAVAIYGFVIAFLLLGYIPGLVG
ncbi:MAG: ATP synthase subunit C [Candidatus Thorarchaeota archaeon SMTZ1-83]